jgi:hypothetical protein
MKFCRVEVAGRKNYVRFCVSAVLRYNRGGPVASAYSSYIAEYRRWNRGQQTWTEEDVSAPV